MFTEKDLEKIKSKGIEIQEIDKQIQLFQSGIDFVELVKPATPDDGIEVLDKKVIENLAEFFEEKRDEYPIVKFIPASGAASRMFKALFEALQALKDNGVTGMSGKEHLRDFFSNLSEYPFYEDLQDAIRKQGAELSELQRSSNFASILEYVLTNKGLNYGNLPKGLLKFHSYKSGSRTAFEEHYEEASLYLANSAGDVNLHFTVSPEHMKLFTSLAETLTTKYQNEQGLLFTINFSVQSPATDTIAVDLDNRPFRQENGELLFRPGGHGALLDNLNKLEESFIFVGNIDNVSPDNNKPLRAEYKKFLGGYLIKKIEKIHTLLDRIERGERGESLQEHTLQIIREISPETATQLETVKNDLFNETAYKFLNRPMRV
jgi:hypothetical protein